MTIARRRVGVIHPYWSFWESAVGPDFAEDRLQLARLGESTLGTVVDVAWGVTVQPGDDIPALVESLDPAIEAIVVVSTMAASPGAVIQLLDAFADRPVVVWAAHLGRAVDADLSYSGITERGGTVGTPMIGAHLTRIGRPYDIVAGELTDASVIGPAVLRASAAGVVRGARLGVIGSTLPGYEWARVSDETLASIGVSVIARPPADLAGRMPDHGDRESAALDGFAIDGAVDDESLDLALRYTGALEEFVREERLSAGTLNCHVPELRLGLGAAPCLALGACTSRGVPWTCTGDVATALAMLLVSSLGAPTLYHEIEALDEESNEAILANSGEHDSRFGTTDGRRIIANPWFPSDPSTASAEYSIAAGPASLVGISTGADGRLTAVVAPGRFTSRTAHSSGTANASFVFDSGPITEAWRRWSLAGVGHHSCATDRNVARDIEAMCRHLGMGFVEV